MTAARFTRRITDPAILADWAAYEAQAAKAAAQYRSHPISHQHMAQSTDCRSCHRPTTSRYGMCRRCRPPGGLA
jgi:hypothetical protein